MAVSAEEMEALAQEEAQEPDFDSLIAAQDAYEASSLGSDSDGGELSNQRALAIDAYAGKNIEPNSIGRSQVVDWAVFETIQWILPSLCRIFAGGDNVVEFMPFDEEDEDAAEQESDFLNYLVTQKNNWFTIILTWCTDALLSKNGYCMAQVEEVLRTEVEIYERQSEEQVALLLDGDIEVVGQNAYPDPDHKPEPVVDPNTGEPVFDQFTGQPIMSEPATLFDLQIRSTEAKKKLAFTVIPPERTKVAEDCTDFTLRDCDYFEVWDNISISAIRAMGHDVDDDIGDDAESDTVEDIARDELLQNTGVRKARTTPDPSTRKVKARWIWCKHDLDGDGIAELIYTFRVGNEILEVEYATRIPVASITPFINTHRHIGTSVADLVFDIQRIKTAILRNGLDSLYFSMHPLRAHSNKVNPDDLMVPSPGGLVEVDTDMPDVAGHVMDLNTPFVFPEAQAGLQHMDTVVESRVGVNRIFQGIDESNLNHHDRIGKLSTMAAQRIEQIARIMGNGIENLFGIAHELLIKSGHQAEAIKLRGKWVNFDPKNWKTGRDMQVVAPYAAGNKDSLLERLMVISSVMERAQASGSRTVTDENVYELELEMAKAADLMGSKLFTNPEDNPPPEPGPDPTMIALEIEQQKAETDAAEADTAAEKVRIDAETDLAKANINAHVQIAIALIKAGQQFSLEEFRNNLKNEPMLDNNEALESLRSAINELDIQLQGSLGDQIGTLQQLIEQVGGEKEIVRDESGNIVGSRPKAVNG